MRHPSESDLALAAGGELSLFHRWRVNRHTAACAACRRIAQAYASDRELLAGMAGEMPSGIHWNRLAAEMKANIRVGIAAAECVSPPAGAAWMWRPAMALASMTLIVAASLWLSSPRPTAPQVARAEGVELEATQAGIEMKQDDRALTLLNPGAEPAVVSVSMRGVLRASYVDSETGRVTITNVYAQ